VNKKRVEEGVKLLLTTDLILDEIAERIGFSSASHFSKRCKEITGNNPSFYRSH
jgi:AraC-like DNA-binding protein